jgi:hypothetical protein
MVVLTVSIVPAMTGEPVRIALELREGQKLISSIRSYTEHGGRVVRLTGKSINTVLSLKDGVYTIQNETRNVVSEDGSGTTTMVPNAKFKYRQTKEGRLVESGSGDLTRAAIENQRGFHFSFPDDGFIVGESFERRAPDGFGIRYSVESVSTWRGRDVLVVRFEPSDKVDFQLKGAFLLDLRSGVTVKSGYEFREFLVGGIRLNGVFESDLVN